jgi:hypothetical protein
LKKGLILLCVLFWPALVLLFVSSAEGKIGDESDGSRAVAVHEIALRDERGATITADDDQAQPFSTRRTCGMCHTYERISEGWHFNAVDANVIAGRAGEPWIYVDAGTATQVPLSYRPWPGTFKPEQLGLSPWGFVNLFGRHTPGGGAGELDSENPDEIIRQLISGRLEINCLSCHNGHPGQDQGGPTGYAVQIYLQNFRWAATGACEFASVSGAATSEGNSYDHLMSDAIAVHYHQGTFGYRNRVLFDIVREVPDERCYFCHSEKIITPSGSEKWAADEDVHMAAGLSCVDCHRNGLDHNITRGYEEEASVSQNSVLGSLTCQGCHLESQLAVPMAGRLGAPKPEHAGIPPIHFDKLTCTSCHSGPWPGEKTYRSKTSRAHALGTFFARRADDALPHIATPVFAEQQGIGAAYHEGLPVVESSGKIAPHRVLWPAFWGSMEDQAIDPIELEIVKQTIAPVIGESPSSDGWPSLGAEQITQVVSLLSDQGTDGTKAVYVSGGKVYCLGDSGQLEQQEHPAARPYLWPIAHNVRPAAQSLGVRGCKDCHSTDAPFLFGGVEIDSPLVSEQGSVKMMVGFQDIDLSGARAFAFAFVFRPWLKIVILGSCAIVGVVLLLYVLRAVVCIVGALSEQDWICK